MYKKAPRRNKKLYYNIKVRRLLPRAAGRPGTTRRTAPRAAPGPWARGLARRGATAVDGSCRDRHQTPGARRPLVSRPPPSLPRGPARHATGGRPPPRRLRAKISWLPLRARDGRWRFRFSTPPAVTSDPHTDDAAPEGGPRAGPTWDAPEGALSFSLPPRPPTRPLLPVPTERPEPSSTSM